MLIEGFDIHHRDGDHSNNSPDNLVLIEHIDHMRLHGMSNGLGRLSPVKGKRTTKNKDIKANEGEIIRRLRKEGVTWHKIGIRLGITRSQAMNWAKL